MKMFIGLSAIWTALYLFGVVMDWLTQHDLLMPAFLMLVAAVAANALRKAIVWAREHGYSWAQIAEARKCLR